MLYCPGPLLASSFVYVRISTSPSSFLVIHSSLHGVHSSPPFWFVHPCPFNVGMSNCTMLNDDIDIISFSWQMESSVKSEALHASSVHARHPDYSELFNGVLPVSLPLVSGRGCKLFSKWSCRHGENGSSDEIWIMHGHYDNGCLIESLLKVLSRPMTSLR